MQVNSKAFLISRGSEGLSTLRNFLTGTIGYRAHLLKSLNAVSFNSTTTLLSVVYQDTPDNWVVSISPKPNAVLSTGLVAGGLGLNVLLAEPVSTGFLGGAVIVNGTSLGTGKYNINNGSNGYAIQVNMGDYIAGSVDYKFTNTGVYRSNFSTYPNSVVGGYTVHTHGAPDSGTWVDDLQGRRRGLTDIGHVILNSSGNIQVAIDQFLSSNNIDLENLITYTSINRGSSIVDLYILYISRPEPQIMTGYPAQHSFIPFGSGLSKVYLTFSTKLNPTQVTSQSSLFAVQSQFNTITSIALEHITLLSDQRTVEIDVSSYFTEKRVYTLIAKPGILSSTGLAKQAPDHWTIIVDSYDGGTGSGDANMNDVMRRIAFRGMGA